MKLLEGDQAGSARVFVFVLASAVRRGMVPYLDGECSLG